METKYHVGDIMTRNPVVAGPLDTLRQLASLMAKRKVGSVLIASDDRLQGIVTERDLVRKAMTQGKDVDTTLASSVMTAAARMTVIREDADVFEALNKMNDASIRHLPVVRGSMLVGLITLKDILRLQPEMYQLIQDKYELLPEKLV